MEKLVEIKEKSAILPTTFRKTCLLRIVKKRLQYNN